MSQRFQISLFYMNKIIRRNYYRFFVRMCLKVKALEKYLFYFIYFVVLYFLILFLNEKIDRSYDNLLNEINKKDLKSIQLYTGYFHYKNWNVGNTLGKEPFKNCPEKRCFAFQTSLLQSPIEKSDGVLVHGPNLWYMPNRSSYKRRNKQLCNNSFRTYINNLCLLFNLNLLFFKGCSSHKNHKD